AAAGISSGAGRRGGVCDSRGPTWCGRKEAVDDANEALPGEVGLLAAPPERLEPEPPHLVAEPPHARVIARDRVVVQMPLQHLLHPASGLRDGIVHTLAHLPLDRLELGSHPLLDRLAPDDKRTPVA